MKLIILNQGHIPSFKNSKMILWRQKRIMTKPEIQKWMQKCAADFESQLRCFFRTRGIEIPTEPQQLSWIASWMPLEDSAVWIGNLSVNWRRVSKGQEGAEIEITPNTQ